MIDLYIEHYKVEMDKDPEIDFTYETIDPNKLSSIKNSFSKTVEIPGTPNNNLAFGYIFRMDKTILDTASSNIGGEYDPHKRVNWTLTNNGVYINKGYCTLDSIKIKDQYKVTYNLTLYGGLGEFFYSLSYNEDGSPKTLYDIYFNWKPKLSLIDPQLYALSPQGERENVLMHCSPEIICQAYHSLEPTEPGNTPTGATKIQEDVVFVPTYGGLYDNFDSKHMIVSTFNQQYSPATPVVSQATHDILMNSFPIVLDEDGNIPQSISPSRTYYYSLTNTLGTNGYRYGLAKFSRDIEPSEAGDIRVNEMPVAIRLSKLLTALSNPMNNGGFTVDWSSEILNSYYWNYGWILLGKIKQDAGGTNYATITKSTTYDGQVDAYNQTTSTPSCTTASTPYALVLSETTFEAGNYTMKLYVKPEFQFTVDFDEWKDWVGPDINNIRRDFFTAGRRKYIYGGSHGQPYGVNLYETVTATFIMHKIQLGSSTTKIICTAYAFSTSGTIPVSFDSDYLKNAIQTWASVTIDEFRFNIMKPSLALVTNSSTNAVNMLANDLITTDLNLTSQTTVTIEQYQGIVCYTRTNNNYAASVVKPGYTITLPGALNFINVLSGTDITTFSHFNSTGFIRFTQNEDQSSGIFLKKTTGFNIIDLTKEQLFAEAGTPMKYITDFAKLLNLRFMIDNVAKKITIMSIGQYYEDTEESLENLVDYSKDIIVKPVVTQSKRINFGLDTPATYPVTIFNKTSEQKFNTEKYNTGIEYNTTETNLLNDLVFKNTIDWQTTSIFHNINPQIPKPWNNLTVSWTLFDPSNAETGINSKEFLRSGTSSTTSLSAAQDFLPKPALFDSALRSVGATPTLLFLNGFVKNYDYKQADTMFSISPRLMITADTDTQFLLNGDRCYLYDFRYNQNFPFWGYYSDGSTAAASWALPFFSRDLFNTYNHTNSTWSDSSKKLASWNLVDQTGLDNVYDLTGTKFITDTGHYYTMQVSATTTADANEYSFFAIPEDDGTARIYTTKWEHFVNMMYEKNTREVTLYADLSKFAEPEEIMRHTYIWQGRKWIIIKIENYRTSSILRQKFTKVTMHLVNDITGLFP